MRRTRAGGERAGTVVATRAITRGPADSCAGAAVASGCASCTASAGVASRAAASMWQQEPGARMASVPEPSRPWQQPLDAGAEPGTAAPRWQKQSPAQVFSDARMSVDTAMDWRNRLTEPI